MLGLGDLKCLFRPLQFPGSVVVATLLGKIIFHSAQGRAVTARVPPSQLQIEPLKIKCVGVFWLLCLGWGRGGRGDSEHLLQHFPWSCVLGSASLFFCRLWLFLWLPREEQGENGALPLLLPSPQPHKLHVSIPAPAEAGPAQCSPAWL